MEDSKQQIANEASVLQLFLRGAYFAPRLQMVIIVPTFQDVRDLCGRLKELNESVPTWVRPSLVQHTTNILRFENGTTIRVVNYPMFARGIRIDALAISDRLSDEQQKETRLDLYPALLSHNNLYYFT